MKLPKPTVNRTTLTKATVASGRTLGTAISWIFKVLGTILLVFITTCSIAAVIGSIYLTKYMNLDLDINLDDYSLNQTSIVKYTDAETGGTYELQSLHGVQNRIMAKYDEIPPAMIDALVSIEDKRFFTHQGVDWKRTGKAVLEMFGSGGMGGSTITQQLIKNITNEKDVTVQRKVQEIFRALEFEKSYSKEEILEWYMNTSYFGQGCYGVKTAAEVYFGKELRDLTAAESACIIGITNKPSLYDPYLNPEKNKERQETILTEMYKQDKLTEAEYTRAVNQTLVLVRAKQTQDTSAIWSYYVDQVFQDVTLDLMAAKNITKPMAQSLLYSAGYQIYATVDMRIQGLIDDIYADDENFPVVKNSEKPQSAILVMDPYTGDVVGLGQRGKKTGNLVDILPTKAQRQPGSSIKPVTVYAAGMDVGFITPYSVISDAPLRNLGGKAWPRNSGGVYKGQTNILTAVQNSVNTIAVRVVDTISPLQSYNFGYSLGLTSLVERRVVTTAKGETVYSDIDLSPMALGGLTRGLSVRELTAAYSAFPNKGVHTAPRTYSKVTDATGDIIILDNSTTSTVVMKEKTAYYMNTVLQQVVKAGTGYSARFDNMTIGGKTGTTTEDKDRWFVGYTPYYVAGSWFGFATPKKISLAQSTNPALSMWKQVMQAIHEGYETKDFFTPSGLVNGAYCLDSGMAPTAACRADPRGSRVASGLMASEDGVKTSCPLHVMVSVDSATGHLATPYCPTENLKQVALLDLNRGMPTTGVVLSDEQYTVRYYNNGAVAVPGVPAGTYRAVASGGDGLPYNSFCQVHLTEVPVTPEPDPNNPYDPNAPVDPNNPYPPGYDPDTGLLDPDYTVPDVTPTLPPTTPDIIID